MDKSRHKIFFLKAHTFIVYYIIVGLRIPGKPILKDLFHSPYQIFWEATYCPRHLILSAYNCICLVM